MSTDCLNGHKIVRINTADTISVERKFMRVFMILSICLFGPAFAFAGAAGLNTNRGADFQINKKPPATTSKVHEKQGINKPAQDEASSAKKHGENIQINRMLLDATNKVRAKLRLQKLQLSSALDFLAQSQAQNMCRTGEFEHESTKFPKGWQMFAERMKKAALSSGAENLAYRTKSHEPDVWADAVFKGWMRSPGHKKNILNPNFKYIGIGNIECKDLVFAAQVFSGEPGKIPGSR